LVVKNWVEFWKWQSKVTEKKCQERNQTVARLDERPRIFIRDKSIFLSVRMIYKDYYRKSWVKRNLWSWVSKGLTTR
jgi:hypothetical protein